jgi:hypothetical protein
MIIGTQKCFIKGNEHAGIHTTICIESNKQHKMTKEKKSGDKSLQTLQHVLNSKTKVPHDNVSISAKKSRSTSRKND